MSHLHGLVGTGSEFGCKPPVAGGQTAKGGRFQTRYIRDYRVDIGVITEHQMKKKMENEMETGII